jgi:hypothetical protein
MGMYIPEPPSGPLCREVCIYDPSMAETVEAQMKLVKKEGVYKVKLVKVKMLNDKLRAKYRLAPDAQLPIYIKQTLDGQAIEGHAAVSGKILSEEELLKVNQ